MLPILEIARPVFQAYLIESNTRQAAGVPPVISRSIAWSEIKLDHRGRRVIAIHKHKRGGSAGVAGSTHRKKSNKGDDKAKATAGKAEQAATITPPKDANAQQTEVAEFTAKQDAKLKAMKAEGKTWAEITKETGRSKQTLWNRYKQIKDDTDADKDKSKHESKSDDKAKDAAQKDDKKKPDKDKGKDTKAQPAAQKKAEQKTTQAASNVAQVGSPTIIEEDDMFTSEELRTIVQIISHDTDSTWKRIASRFADKTGRRVHAEDLREKFEGFWPYAWEKT
jgi:hypothetical protein